MFALRSSVLSGALLKSTGVITRHHLSVNKQQVDGEMTRLLKMTVGLGALGVFAVISGYFVDQHRCKRINYEETGYEMPTTVLLSAKQCLDAAHAIKLRGYARNV